MKLLILFVILTLTGCATPPSFLAAMYDNADMCQRKNYTGTQPGYCGAADSRTYYYVTRNNSPLGEQAGYAKR